MTKGLSAWFGPKYEYAVRPESVEQLVNDLNLRIGWDLAASPKNARAEQYLGIKKSFKQVAWNELQTKQNEMLYLCWPADARKVQQKAKRERVRLLLLTPNFDGHIDQHSKILGAVAGSQFNPPQPNHSAVFMDYRDACHQILPQRTIISDFYGQQVLHMMTASEVSTAYRDEYFAEELVHRGLVHPDFPIPQCCAKHRDLEAERKVWKRVALQRPKSVYNIPKLLHFLRGQEPLAVEIAILAFQQGVHQSYYGQSHVPILCKDNKEFRRNRQARVHVLAKEFKAKRFIVFGPERPMPNLMKYPWGVVPKADGGHRRTTNDGYGRRAINKFIPKLRVELDDLSVVVKLLCDLYWTTGGKERLGLYKNDFKSAFRNMYVRVQDLYTNGGYISGRDARAAFKSAGLPEPAQVRGVADNGHIWIVDAHNNNGRRSCPALWCMFSRLFIQALRQRLRPSAPLPGPLAISRALINFVDDNCLANTWSVTSELAPQIKAICDDVLSPAGYHKVVGPTEFCKMLGPEFDVSQVGEGKVMARIPTEKRNQCTADWKEVIVGEGSTLKAAQSVAGKMNWHRVIAPQLGYVMPKVYAWTTALQRIIQRQSRCEAQFMKIPKNLARHVIMIAQWYQKVLTTWKATNIVHAIATGRPSRNLCIFTDANGGRQGDDAEHGGLGWHCPDLKLCGYAQFTDEILRAAFQIHTTSSTWLEWFAVAAALLHLKNRGWLDGAHIEVLADSKPMVDGMNNGSAAPHMYPFLLMVVRICIESSARIRLTWISRESNKTADALARGQFSVELFRPGQLPRREITACSDTLKAYFDLLA